MVTPLDNDKFNKPKVIFIGQIENGAAIVIAKVIEKALDPLFIIISSNQILN